MLERFVWLRNEIYNFNIYLFLFIIIMFEDFKFL